MAALVAGTVHAVASTSQIISGAYELSRKLLEVLRPWCARLDSEDVHYIYCIQRQIECLIRPLEFCVLWSRHRDAVSQQTIVLVEDTLRRVWARVRRLDQPRLRGRVHAPTLMSPIRSSCCTSGPRNGNVVRGRLKVDTATKIAAELRNNDFPVIASASQNLESLASEPRTSSQLPRVPKTGRSGWGCEGTGSSMSTSSVLRWCVEELQIATTQLTLTLTTIQAYRAFGTSCSSNEAVVPSIDRLSPATLLKASRHICAMAGRTGDVCLRRGSLFFYGSWNTGDTVKRNLTPSTWHCVYPNAFLRVAKRQKATGYPAVIIIEPAVEASYRSPHHRRSASEGRRQNPGRDDLVHFCSRASNSPGCTVQSPHQVRRVSKPTFLPPRCVAQSSQDSGNSSLENEFWLVADQYGPEAPLAPFAQAHGKRPSPRFCSDQMDRCDTGTPSQRKTILPDLRNDDIVTGTYVNDNLGGDNLLNDADLSISESVNTGSPPCDDAEKQDHQNALHSGIPTALHFPIEMAISMRLQLTELPVDEACRAHEYSFKAELQGEPELQPEPCDLPPTSTDRNAGVAVFNKRGVPLGPALLWDITQDDLASFHEVAESAWLSALFLPDKLHRDSRRGKQISSNLCCCKTLAFAFVFDREAHNAIDPKEPSNRGLENDMRANEDSALLVEAAPSANLLAPAAGATDYLSPLEILYVARLCFLEAALSCPPAYAGLERWLSPRLVTYRSSFMRRHENEDSIWAHVSDEVLDELLSDCFVD